MGLEFAPDTPPEIMPDGTKVSATGVISETEVESESPEEKQTRRSNAALSRIAKARTRGNSSAR